MKTSRRVRTMLYGDQRIEATELDLLHTPALQRLYDLHQLGLTDRVFIDASHSRLQHVIGVLEQADNITEAIAANLERRKSRRLEYRGADGKTVRITAAALANYVRTRRRAARLMGLLHDLTHAPYGHTLEDEIELQPQKHDDPARQADAFYRLICQYVGCIAIDLNNPLTRLDGAPPRSAGAPRHATQALQFSAVLDAPFLSEPPTDASFIDYVASLAAPLLRDAQTARTMERLPGPQELAQLFHDLRFAMRALLWLDALHKDKLSDLLPRDAGAVARVVLDEGSYPFEKLIDRILADTGDGQNSQVDRFNLQRDAFLLDVIGNTICADLLDYARRDSQFAGLKLDYDVDRIVENFTIVSYRRSRAPAKDASKDYATLEPMLRTAISIFSHKLRIDAPGELMNLLQVRFYVYQRVLFHPTKCIAGAMLGSSVQLMGWSALPPQFRFVGDAVFLHELGEVSRLLRDFIQAGPPGANNRLKPLSEISAGISERLDRLPETSVTAATRELVRARSSHEIGDVLADLHSAIRLLDRLSARRYHRPVFRLLPNVSVPGLEFGAADIASVFLDAETRAATERAIEARTGLPKGTVTIHCPKSDGPKKIAEILILSERNGQERAVPLRRIREVDPEIFEKHQKAIEAVEEMYASMWRLVVSVAPPFHAQYEMINKRISRVLLATLRREKYENLYEGASDDYLDALAVPPLGVPNDENMVLELSDSIATNGDSDATVRLLFPDGTEETRPQRFVAIADRAVPQLMRASLRIEGWANSGRWAAGDAGEMTLEEAITAAIPVPAPAKTSTESNIGEQPIRPRKRQARDSELTLPIDHSDDDAAGRRSP